MTKAKTKERREKKESRETPEPTTPTPGCAEGDMETVEQDLLEKERRGPVQ